MPTSKVLNAGRGARRMEGLSIGITGSDKFLSGDLQSRNALTKRLATSEIDHLFVADHISFHTGFGMDALINAATLSAMLPNMTIVTGVYLLALRHPVAVARQLSSLSLSAPGRLIFGVGIGGEDRHEMEICGVDPSKRGKHTNHSLTALRELMSGKEVSYDCDFFSYENARISPKPDPKIPILIGGRSEAALKRTAKYGEGWLGVWVSPERFEMAVRQIADLKAKEQGVQWMHGIQVWAGVGDSARENLARGMEAIYKIPFEKFERYSPYGPPEKIAEFLCGYVESGARIINIEARGSSIEESIEVVSSISALLHREFPNL